MLVWIDTVVMASTILSMRREISARFLICRMLPRRLA
jgi:hypothetical protein